VAPKELEPFIQHILDTIPKHVSYDELPRFIGRLMVTGVFPDDEYFNPDPNKTVESTWEVPRTDYPYQPVWSDVLALSMDNMDKFTPYHTRILKTLLQTGVPFLVAGPPDIDRVPAETPWLQWLTFCLQICIHKRSERIGPTLWQLLDVWLEFHAPPPVNIKLDIEVMNVVHSEGADRSTLGKRHSGSRWTLSFSFMEHTGQEISRLAFLLLWAL
jgi:hypothetical protein